MIGQSSRWRTLGLALMAAATWAVADEQRMIQPGASTVVSLDPWLAGANRTVSREVLHGLGVRDTITYRSTARFARITYARAIDTAAPEPPLSVEAVIEGFVASLPGSPGHQLAGTGTADTTFAAAVRYRRFTMHAEGEDKGNCLGFVSQFDPYRLGGPGSALFGVYCMQPEVDLGPTVAEGFLRSIELRGNPLVFYEDGRP